MGEAAMTGEQYYTQRVADKLVDGSDAPIDSSTLYVALSPSDPTMTDLVQVARADTRAVRETITPEVFDEKYQPVADHTPSPPPTSAPIVQSPNGSQWAITVDNDGNVIATPLPPTP